MHIPNVQQHLFKLSSYFLIFFGLLSLSSFPGRMSPDSTVLSSSSFTPIQDIQVLQTSEFKPQLEPSPAHLVMPEAGASGVLQ